MEKYIGAMLDRTNALTQHWNYLKCADVQEKLTEWINERDKHLAIDFFGDFDNRIFYTKRLYRCRVNCFYEILQHANKNPKINKIMKNESSVVSFGCGPGPEIAAYIGFVRTKLNRKTRHLDFTAVDCLKEWGTFISVISDLDEYATIKFQTGELNNKYLLRMKQSDICIMSYPHAMNFEDIWSNLKKKFSLIIFIDQAKGALLQKARQHGFEFVNFRFNGDKTFFYYVDESYYSEKEARALLTTEEYFHNQYLRDKSRNTRTCERLLHQLDFSTDICKQLIDVGLSCGHKSRMYCYQDERQIRASQKCSENVRISCPRNKHESFARCGSKSICQEKIITRLKCGHKKVVTCDDRSNNLERCTEMDLRTCKRNIHSGLVSCSSIFICKESIIITLACGHLSTMKCDEDETSVSKEIICKKRLLYKCRRKLHSLSSSCGSRSKCHEMVGVKRTCGHSILVECCKDEKEIIDGSRCMELEMKICNRGIHREAMSCCSPIICTKMIMVELLCRHKHLMKCSDKETLAQCGELLTKRCKRSIHKRKMGCSDPNVCNIRCSLQLQCGCRKMVHCDEYDDARKDAICEDDCKMKMKQLSAMATSEHERDSCCVFPIDKRCQTLCNMTLRCGHSCQWSCYLCLNGRLHRPCLMSCSRRVKCGHPCADYCHSDDCENCSENCYRNKLSKLLRLKQHMAKGKQSSWTRLFEQQSAGGQLELRNMLEKMVFDVQNLEFSSKVLRYYDVSYQKMKELLDFNEALRDSNFPGVLDKYIGTVKVVLLALVRWINPEECSAVRSFEDFDEEFERMISMVTLCQVARSYIAERTANTPSEIIEILNKVLDKELHFDDLRSLVTNMTMNTECSKSLYQYNMVL